jgi:beta-phosphoglucomutase-like phosphatase (HAD superfamily)
MPQNTTSPNLGYYQSIIDSALDYLEKDQIIRGKLYPEINLLVASETKVQPQSCLVIGDPPIGVQAALAV